MRIGLNSSMRNLLGKVALVLSVAMLSIASGASARADLVTRGDVTSVPSLVRGSDAACLDVLASSDHEPLASFQTADAPSDDPEPDNLGTEREVPGAVPSFGGSGLDAPHSTRVRHLSAEAEAAVTRAVLPAVQPPRG